jgi:hypothetical protein
MVVGQQFRWKRLIREMSIANPLWGAPRIHGELLKLDIAIGQTGVAKYMAKRRGPPSQGWKTFLRNHAHGIAAIDLFVVPTISFRRFYGLLIMGHGMRQVIWFGVTTHPTAEWIANQITEACGWEQLPRYLIRIAPILLPDKSGKGFRYPQLSPIASSTRSTKQIDRGWTSFVFEAMQVCTR